MDENTIVIVRKLNAPIEAVWNAWTTAESLLQWKAPEGMTTPEADVDLHVGGAYKVTMAGGHVPEGKVTVRGVYKIIEKPNKLVFSWKWDGQDEETLITILLNSTAQNQTELTLIHEGFVTEDSKKQHTIGWESTIDKLEKFLAE